MKLHYNIQKQPLLISRFLLIKGLVESKIRDLLLMLMQNVRQYGNIKY